MCIPSMFFDLLLTYISCNNERFFDLQWNVLGQIRIGFFAKRPIDKGEEITIDYQFVQFG